jgi:hypothetical protein
MEFGNQVLHTKRVPEEMCLGYLQVDDQADGRTNGRPLATTEEKEWPTKIYNIEP